jgi:hypothetical protein
MPFRNRPVGFFFFLFFFFGGGGLGGGGGTLSLGKKKKKKRKKWGHFIRGDLVWMMMGIMLMSFFPWGLGKAF